MFDRDIISGSAEPAKPMSQEPVRLILANIGATLTSGIVMQLIGSPPASQFDWAGAQGLENYL